MLPVLIIGGVVLATGCAAIAKSSRDRKRAVMTSERRAIYDAAMTTLKDADKLRSLADAFESVGLSEQADMLQKRADLRELPDDIKEGRREAFRAMMRNTDPSYVNRVASAFEAAGAVSAAANGRLYAAGLSADSPENVQKAIDDLAKTNLKAETRELAVSNLRQLLPKAE